MGGQTMVKLSIQVSKRVVQAIELLVKTKEDERGKEKRLA